MLYELVYFVRNMWDEVFKSGPSKFCGRQPLKYLKGYGLLSRPYPFKFFKGCLPQILLGPFLTILTQLRVTNLTINPVESMATF